MRYRYRIMESRLRHLMSETYTEWFEPLDVRYDTYDKAVVMMATLQDSCVYGAQFKIQRRPMKPDWEDM